MIAWFARNIVAANCLLLLILALGLYSVMFLIPVEVEPSSALDRVVIKVSQRGAAPEEMEAGVTSVIETAVADLPYIDELLSTSTEELSRVTIKLRAGTDKQKALNEVKGRVDALSNLPTTIERPIIQVPTDEFEVLTVVIYGDLDEGEMATIAHQLRLDLVNAPGITQARVGGLRSYQISISVAADVLREYGLNRADIAAAIDAQAIDLGAGQVRTREGDILLRTNNRAYHYQDFDSIVVRRFEDGSPLTLGQIAAIDDSFDESRTLSRFNGERAVFVDVYRVGKESAVSVSDTVRTHLEDVKTQYPDTVKLAIFDDDARFVRQRLSTLFDSGLQGALLVMLLLGLFLRPSVAFWVVAGIPVCFAGALALFPVMGVSINTISLFSFILVLGVVVDDAIVTGENIYIHRARGRDGVTAAIEGTREVAVPVIFGLVTTMLMFVPMLMVNGEAAAHAKNIAAGVIAALIFSLIESKLILPAHLTQLDLGRSKQRSWLVPLERARENVASGLEWVLMQLYQPLLSISLKNRYVTVLSFVGILVVVSCLVSFGWLRYTFLPQVVGERAAAEVVFAVGTPIATLERATERLEEVAKALREEYRLADSNDSLIDNILTNIDGVDNKGAVGLVVVEVDQQLAEKLDTNAKQVAEQWRETISELPGAERLSFYSGDIGGLQALQVRLVGNDIAQLQAAVGEVRQFLSGFSGVFDIEDTLETGKPQLSIQLKPEAELLGMDLQTVTAQVRHAFFGVEAQRIQRGQDDVRVMVLAPLQERNDLQDLDELLIVTPAGGEVAFADVADVTWGQSSAAIERQNQERVAVVSARINHDQANLQVLENETQDYVADMIKTYPALSHELGGDSEVEEEANQVLLYGSLGVLAAIFGLLAVAFKSYLQPFIILSVIPFSLIGAILGHAITGTGLSMFSIFGILALIGVVINDSLVLVDWINRRLRAGEALWEVVNAAGVARFRPILLTSLSTFFGLVPILFQTSMGAQYLIPMAISLGFGILFATFITLLLVPCHYLILKDIQSLADWSRLARSSDAEKPRGNSA